MFIRGGCQIEILKETSLILVHGVEREDPVLGISPFPGKVSNEHVDWVLNMEMFGWKGAF